MYVGQPIFIVVADTHDNARAVPRARRGDVRRTAGHLHAAGSQGGRLVCAAADAAQARRLQAAFESAPRVVKGQLFVGGQEQFYLEGQIAYAIPKEDNGMLVQCSTQHPSEMQHVVAHAIGVHSHKVQECRRMGGGFGGKESQSALWAASAALRRPSCAVRSSCARTAMTTCW
jgi:xanthine dehydrogenase large subunit